MKGFMVENQFLQKTICTMVIPQYNRTCPSTTDLYHNLVEMLNFGNVISGHLRDCLFPGFVQKFSRLSHLIIR